MREAPSSITARRRAPVSRVSGSAEVVVQIATGSEHRLGIAGLGTQDAGEHLLDRGLAAGAPSWPPASWWNLAPVQRAQSSQARTEIAHQQFAAGARRRLRALDQRSHRALGGNLGDSRGRRKRGPLQGNEQLAGPDGATVGGNRRKTTSSPDQRASSATVNSAGGEEAQACGTSQAARARSACSMSENGWRTPSIS